MYGVPLKKSIFRSRRSQIYKAYLRHIITSVQIQLQWKLLVQQPSRWAAEGDFFRVKDSALRYSATKQ